MKLIEFLIMLHKQSINEKIAVAPRRFPEYSNARIKDIDAIEALFQNINKRNDKWLDNDDVYAYRDMWKEVDRYQNVDIDYLTRNSFGGFSRNVLERMRDNLTYMSELLRGDDKSDISFLMKVISWLVSNKDDIEKLASLYAEYSDRHEGLLTELQERGYNREEYDGYPEELEAIDAFHATLDDLNKLHAPIQRIADAVPKYQVILDKRAAAYNNEYLPTDMQKVETLWHTTIHADEIAHQGFQSEKPSGRQGVGMYGDQSGISMTYDRKIAIDIMRGLREFSMIANNQVTARQILGWFNSEGIDLERVRSMMDGIPFEETVKSKTKMYNVYLWLTGIRSNPVFANVDELVEKLVGVNPKDIGIIQAEVDTTKDMTSKPAESELVVSPSAVLSTKRVA